MRIIKFALLAVFLILTIAMTSFFLKSNFVQTGENLSHGKIVLHPEDRILVLAPHPDDEVLGCGGVIQKALAKKLPVKVAFLTYGDNNQWSFLLYRKHPVVMPRAVQKMGLIRYDEAVAAAKTLGLSKDNLIFLGYPDFRTLNIWTSHWGNSPPEKSMFTNVKAVPYSSAFRPGTPYKGEEILKDLKTIFLEFKPTKIFVSHPADHNSDHLALYLFTRIALWDLDQEIHPKIFPYLIHSPRWPVPRGYHPEKELIPMDSFKEIKWEMLNLTSEEVSGKNKALQKHKTQYDYSRNYLTSFVRVNEFFGDLPAVKLTGNASALISFSGEKVNSTELPEDLNKEERALFTGIEGRSVYLKGEHLIIDVCLSKPIGKAAGISLYVFGYRKDEPFGQMPKIRIRFGAIEQNAYDQLKKLPKNTVKVIRQSRRITVSVPLKVLNHPQKILTSARIYLGALPLDLLSWRILDLSE